MKKLLIAIFVLSLMMTGTALGYTDSFSIPIDGSAEPLNVLVAEDGEWMVWTFDFPVEQFTGEGQLNVALIIATDGEGEGPAFQIHNNDGVAALYPWGTWMYGSWGPAIDTPGTYFGWPNHNLDVPIEGNFDWVEAIGQRHTPWEGIVSGDGVMVIRIKKSVLGESFHWAASPKVGTGFYEAYDVTMEIPTGFGWGIPLVDMGVPNYEFVPPPPVVDMSSFVIDHAKIDFKEKPDDDKVRVQGKLDPASDVDIGDDVTVTVGPLSETITMVEKGKKGEKWEYKRPKYNTGDIKHMTIDWKNGKFDIRMDKADLTGIENPVTISIKIGDDFGEETIEMREKKYHWDYIKGLEASAAEESIIQTESGLSQNYPNPFNPTTTIEYSLAEGSDVILKIYNLSGKLIRTLVNEYQSAGYYSITWYGDNEVGQEIASGVYFYQIQAGDFVSTKKMVVLK